MGVRLSDTITRTWAMAKRAHPLSRQPTNLDERCR